MRKVLAALWIMLLCSSTSVAAQVSVGIGFPGVSIGINLPVYPESMPVPGYPVYYAPQVNTNYFFYDGMYWVYQRDNWYASSWYNGPWGLVAPEAVPLFVLRVPVRYYRRPPAYFRGWRSEAPPRWGEHWGNSWEQRHSGWDNVGSRLCARAGPAAHLSAAIFGESISPRGAAAGASKPELPIPAARRRSRDSIIRHSRRKVRPRPRCGTQCLRKAAPRLTTSASRADQLRSRRSLPCRRADSRRKVAAEIFRGRPPPERLLRSAARQPSHRDSSHNKRMGSRHQGHRSRTNHHRKSMDPRRNHKHPRISRSNNSKRQLSISSRGKAGRKHRKATDPHRNQSRARRRAPTRASSKVGSASEGRPRSNRIATKHDAAPWVLSRGRSVVSGRVPTPLATTRRMIPSVLTRFHVVSYGARRRRMRMSMMSTPFGDFRRDLAQHANKFGFGQ